MTLVGWLVLGVGVGWGYDIADSFRFPLNSYVLGCNPFWGVCVKPWHTGEDSTATAGTSVYAPSNGEVKHAQYHSGDKNYGGMYIIEFTLPNGEKGCLVFGHMNFGSFTKNTTDKKSVRKGEYLGDIGNYSQNGGWSEHLHFGIHKGAYLSGVVCGGEWNYGGYTTCAEVKNDWYDPYAFINNHMLIGDYSDGFHTDGTSQAFIDAFSRHKAIIGLPFDNGGSAYVHKWQGLYDPTYRVWLQDFQGDVNSSHYGTDGKTSLILNDYLLPKKAYLVKEGMWGHYRGNNGPFNYGEPYTEEITAKFANSPYNNQYDQVSPGETVVVQKFMRVFDFGGVPAFNNERRTLMYNKTRNSTVTHYPVGEFSIGNDTCPSGEQIYVIVDSIPANDMPWPLAGVKTPTAKWFTKPGAYNFVRHTADGQRLQGWGVTASITEGNSQSMGYAIYTPENVTAVAESTTSIRLNLTLPGGTDGFNIRVYQAGQKILDIPASESVLVENLSPGTNFCFQISVVENASNAESSLCDVVCAATIPVPLSQSYVFDHSVTCKGIEASNPWNPVNETTLFYNVDTTAYIWAQIDNVYGSHTVNWKWYDPNGSLSSSSTYTTTDSATSGYDYWSWYKIWSGLDITSKNIFGQWHVDIYVDDLSVDTKYFTLAIDLGQLANLVASNVTSTGVTLGWTAAANAAVYRIYRDGQLIHETTQTSYVDIGLISNGTYVYQVKAANGNVESSFSNSATITTLFATPEPAINLVAGNITANSIALTWTAGANASKYQVYRNGLMVGETVQNSFINSGLIAATSYTYYVVSVNGDLSSAPSASVVATTSNSGPVLAAPTNVRATVLQ